MSGDKLALGAVAALAALGLAKRRGSRSDQLSLGLQQKTRPRKRRPCPDRFYSPKNQAVDAQGQPLVFYHGSRTPDIKRFTTDENTTAYGLFFAPDFNTAAFYGPYVYKVHLYIENLIDLDDNLRTVAHQSSFEDSTRMMKTDWGEYTEASTSDLNRTLYDLIEGQQDSPAVRRVLSQWMDTLDEDIPEDERWEYLRETLDYEEPEEDDEVIQKVFQADPRIRQQFNAAHPMMNSEVAAIEGSYGSQRFYMNHQDNIMRTAENMGYDGVVFTDPSPSGLPVSWVVFGGAQVCILGTEDGSTAGSPRLTL